MVGKFFALLSVGVWLSHGAFADFAIDRSVMSDAYSSEGRGNAS